MSKINKFFSAISKIVAQPSLLNLVLEDKQLHKNRFLTKYPKLESLPQITFNDLIADYRENIDLFFLDGGSMPTDLALLKTLASRNSMNSYFEIGTWRGESVWNVSKKIKDCTTFNLSKDDIISLTSNEKYAELHGFLSKKNPSILHLQGNTKTFDFAALNRKYDLIFIDGDHTYEMVKNDTAKVFEHLVHDHTIVVWHDYAYNPEQIRYEVFEGILDGVPKEKHHQLYHVANTMCAIYSKEYFKTQRFDSPKEPDVIFEVKLEMKYLP